MDVAQDIFLAVISGINKFQRGQPCDSFRGWLRTICHYQVCDHFRARQQQASAVGGLTADQLSTQLQQTGKDPTQLGQYRVLKRLGQGVE